MSRNANFSRCRGSHIICLFLIAGSIQACGSIPQPNYYTLKIPEANSGDGYATPAAFPVVVGINNFESGLFLDDDRIVYRDSEYEIKFWNYQRWIAPPRVLVAEHLSEYLKSRRLFSRIVKFPSTVRVQYLIGGKVLAFEEWDKGGQWFARVGFELYVRDLDTNRIIWQKKYDKMEPIAKKAPVGVVASISTALASCFEQLADDLKMDLAGHIPN